MLDVSNRSRVDLALVESEARSLLSAFAALLDELGHPHVARVLPLVGDDHSALDDATKLRALTMGFHLLSLAEQHAASVHRHDTRKDMESGLWASTVAELLAQPGGRDAMLEALGSVHVEPVFTAHPTEARRVSALEQWLALSSELSDHGLDRAGRDALLIRLERLFRTGEVRLRKPSIADERAVVVHTLTRVIAPALGVLEAAASRAIEALGADPTDARLPTIRFGTWVGGDRDGHPLVTAETTAESLREYRKAAINFLRSQLLLLTRSLSISGIAHPPPAEFETRIAEVSAQLGVGAELAARYPEEPFRRWTALIAARLPAEDPVALDDTCYQTAEELSNDLAFLRRMLVAIGATRLARSDVDPVLAAARAFGFHLVTLDLRQNSFVHDRAIEALCLAAGEPSGFSEWSEPRRRSFADRELESGRPFTISAPHRFDAGVEDSEIAVAPLRAVAAHRAAFGGAGLGSFIVSMTRQVSDLEVPYLLAREAGLLVRTDDGLVCPLHVVPLFETIEDLERAPAVLDDYLSLPIVQRSLALRARGGMRIQDVMVGYSDSNKDSGPCASLWAVHVAQREMLRVAELRGVVLRFFHGRGGSGSRGAGPTFRFLSALPTNSVRGGLRMTEQGEIVFQKYGTVDAAAYNLELLAAGAIRSRALDLLESRPGASGPARRERGSDEPELSLSLDVVARASADAYRSLLAVDGLLSFFRGATPIDVIERSGIGSRPARRSGQSTLADLRAIPWVFAWAQSRIGLTGWFGLGSGLEALERRDPAAFERLVGRALDWAPMRYIVGNASVSVLSTDVAIAELYGSLLDDAELRARIMRVLHDEFALARRMLERVYGGPLDSKRERVHRLMELRTPSLRRLHFRQVELLRRWRATERSDDSIGIELLGTVNAIAAGLRTTG